MKDIKDDGQLLHAKAQYAVNQEAGKELKKAIEAYESRDLFSLYYTNERSWGLWLFKGSKTLLRERIANASGAGKIGPTGSERCDQFVGGNSRATEINATEAAYIQNPPEGEGWELRLPSAGDEYITSETNVLLKATVGWNYDGAHGFISGLRFCRKPQEKKEVSALFIARDNLKDTIKLAEATLKGLSHSLEACEKAINEG